MKYHYFNSGSLKTLAVLAPLVFLAALSLDIYAPALPSLKKALDVSAGTIQLTVSLFVVALGVGQLLLGPLSDRWGRKPMMLAGLSVYIASSLLCALSNSAFWLIVGRIFQAFGCACTMSCAFASVRDIYKENASPLFSVLNSTIAIVPLVAPVIGGYLVTFFEWQACFAFLAIFGVLIFFTTLFGFGESRPKSTKTLIENKNENPERGNLDILFHPVFIPYALLSTCGYTCFLGFLSVTPYILISLLHVSVQSFGYYFASISIIIFFGSLICSRLILKYNTARVGLWGAVAIIYSGLAMLLIYLWVGLTIAGYLLPILIMGTGGCFLMGAGAGGAITPFEKAGFASSILGCIQFTLSSLIITLFMLWPVESPLPFSCLVVLLGTLSAMLSIYLLSHGHRTRRF